MFSWSSKFRYFKNIYPYFVLYVAISFPDTYPPSLLILKIHPRQNFKTNGVCDVIAEKQHNLTVPPKVVPCSVKSDPLLRRKAINHMHSVSEDHHISTTVIYQGMLKTTAFRRNTIKSWARQMVMLISIDNSST